MAIPTAEKYKVKLYLCHVALPMVIAACIYLFLRPAKPFLLELHPSLTYSFLKLPSSFNWFVYNLPDGLWAYSFFSFMQIVTRDDSPKVRSIYLKSSVLLMLGYEMGQIGFVIGTFDLLDLAAITAGIYCSFFMLR